MSAIAPERSTADLLQLLSHATHVLTTELTAALAELGMSQRTYCVLAHAMSGERTQSQIAEACLLDKTTMVVTLDRLEKEGLARREPCTLDRRAHFVKLTEKGLSLVETAQGTVDEIYDDVLSALPAKSRRALVDGLSQLVSDRLSAPTPCAPPAKQTRKRRT